MEHVFVSFEAFQKVETDFWFSFEASRIFR